MFDFMVAAKAELEKQTLCAADSPTASGRDEPGGGGGGGGGVCARGHASWSFTGPCCGVLLLRRRRSRRAGLNEGTTGGPSSEEIATQVSLSLITAWRGELTVSAISGETVANEGYCDGCRSAEQR